MDQSSKEAHDCILSSKPLFLLFDGMGQLRGWEGRGQESEKYRVIFTLQLQGPFNGHLVMRKMKLCTRECCEI